jgi:carbon-monoxide dehydrogenase medium subunit
VADLSEPLTGQPADAAVFDEAARFIQDTLDPEPDIHATAEYRRHLAGVLTARALLEATNRAVEATT